MWKLKTHSKTDLKSRFHMSSATDKTPTPWAAFELKTQNTKTAKFRRNLCCAAVNEKKSGWRQWPPLLINPVSACTLTGGHCTHACFKGQCTARTEIKRARISFFKLISLQRVPWIIWIERFKQIVQHYVNCWIIWQAPRLARYTHESFGMNTETYNPTAAPSGAYTAVDQAVYPLQLCRPHGVLYCAIIFTGLLPLLC
jgi:hypothetical protein